MAIPRFKVCPFRLPSKLSWSVIMTKKKVFLDLKIIICILHISICALLDSRHGAKGGWEILVEEPWVQLSNGGIESRQPLFDY